MKKRVLTMTLAACCAMGTTAFAAEVPAKKAVKAIPVLQDVYFLRGSIHLDGYNIEGNTYFRLRDMEGLTDTFWNKAPEGKDWGQKDQFDVRYSAEEKTIYVEKGKKESGVDFVKWRNPQETTAIPTDLKLVVNGVESSSKGYNIGGYTYYKLRDIMEKDLNLPITWDKQTDRIYIFLKPAESVAQK